MKNKFIKNVNLIPATLADYPLIQNMGRFYIYELSRNCGFESDEYDWSLPKDGLYEANDFKKYFVEPNREAYLIKANNEITGFVLLNKTGTHNKIDEFFIIARFQNKGIGSQVARQIWQIHQGLWEVSVLPENKPAHMFWRNTINKLTKGNYQEEIKLVQKDGYKAERVIFEFDSRTL
ncbi:MAG: GNAT family N-acetyltransferase [Rickettsia endosymbiont of Pentastiridius leporinus]